MFFFGWFLVVVCVFIDISGETVHTHRHISALPHTVCR